MEMSDNERKLMREVAALRVIVRAMMIEDIEDPEGAVRAYGVIGRARRIVQTMMESGNSFHQIGGQETSDALEAFLKTFGV